MSKTIKWIIDKIVTTVIYRSSYKLTSLTRNISSLTAAPLSC